MSKLTLSAVLYCLRIAVTFTEKVIRLIYTIVDLVDDGCRNNSVDWPAWMPHLMTALNTLENVGAHLNDVEDAAAKTETKD